MTSPQLSPVAEGTRWPSGEGVDLALLPLTEDELYLSFEALRTGLVRGQASEVRCHLAMR